MGATKCAPGTQHVTRYMAMTCTPLGLHGWAKKHLQQLLGREAAEAAHEHSGQAARDLAVAVGAQAHAPAAIQLRSHPHLHPTPELHSAVSYYSLFQYSSPKRLSSRRKPATYKEG